MLTPELERQIYEFGLSAQAEDERERFKTSLKEFMHGSWHCHLPRTPFVDGWHIDCMVAHLEAVQRKEIRTLLVNLPPRHLKSTLFNVILPPWLWACDPGLKMMTGSYALGLSKRDHNFSRKIVQSPWYQKMFPDVVVEKDLEGRTYLTEGGARFCFSTDGTVTGEGGQVVVFDDPSKAADMYSPKMLANTRNFYSTTLPSRLDDPLNATTIVVMQRLGPNDLSGYMLAEQAADHDPDFVHLVLPARFDPDRRMVTRWFRDPRKEKGDLLWPERMDHKAIRGVIKKMTPESAAAQMDQLATESTGSILPRKRWRVWTQRKQPSVHKLVVSFDPALKDTSKPTATSQLGSRWGCSVWGLFPFPDAKGKEWWHAVVLDAWADHMGYPEAKERLLETISDWTLDGEPPDHVLIEDKAAGPILLAELSKAGINGLAAHNPGRDDKIVRAGLSADLFSSGRVWAMGAPIKGENRRSSKVLRPTSEMIVSECEQFPRGDYDDLVDSTVQALSMLRNTYYLATDLDEEPEGVYDDPEPWKPTEVKEPAYG